MPNKIKVLHLIKSLGRGGAEKLIPETALVHDHSRFEFHCLYFYHQKSNIVDELEAAGIRVHLIPSGNLGLFFQVKKVRQFIFDHQIDIIHAHLPWAGIMARSVGKGLEIPIVYTEHNTWDRYNKLSYWGNRLTFKKQDIAIAVSNEVALSMQLNSMIDPYCRGGRLKVKVIQNGVNTEVFRKEVQSTKYQVPGNKVIENEGIETSEEVFRIGEENKDRSIIESEREKVKSPITNHQSPIPPDCNLDLQSRIPNPESRVPNSQSQISNLESRISTLKSQLLIPPNSPVIGKVAVFRSQKRLWIWVDIALRILEKWPDTHFLLVGDGEWRERILDQILKSGKSSHFHWVGVQKEVIPFLSVMDIYLSTSEFEGLPIAMLEAMSCEVPIVATRAGGIGEVIQHGVQGFLTDIDEYEGLVDFCVQLIQNKELHHQMSLAARERVISQFSMSRMVRDLETVYESVIAKS